MPLRAILVKSRSAARNRAAPTTRRMLAVMAGGCTLGGVLLLLTSSPSGLLPSTPLAVVTSFNGTGLPFWPLAVETYFNSTGPDLATALGERGEMKPLVSAGATHVARTASAEESDLFGRKSKSVCPLGWTRGPTDKCFRLSRNMAPHDQCMKECSAHGQTASLACIDSFDESVFLRTLLSSGV